MAPIKGPNHAVRAIGLGIGLLGAVFLATGVGKSIFALHATNFYWQAGWTMLFFSTAEDFVRATSGTAALLFFLVSTFIGHYINVHLLAAERKRTEEEFNERRQGRNKLN